MLIKQFIKECTDILQYDDQDLRTFILGTALPNATDKVLEFLKYHEKEYIAPVGSDLKVKLPADVFSISKVYLNDTPIYRTIDPVPGSGFYFISTEYIGADYTTALKLHSILSANIKNSRSRYPEGYFFEILDILDNTLGKIYDSENIFFKDDDFSTPAQVRLHIYDDEDVVRIKAGDILELDVNYGILSILLPKVDAETTYYLAEDGSLYLEAALTTLVKRNYNKFKVNKLIMDSLKTTDEVKIIYLAKARKHISLYDDDEYIDLYKKAILLYTCSDSFTNFMKKEKEGRIQEDLGDKELMRLKRETCYAKEKSVDRRLGRTRQDKKGYVYFP